MFLLPPLPFAPAILILGCGIFILPAEKTQGVSRFLDAAIQAE